MFEIQDIVQQGDWKLEKHVPVIEIVKEKAEGVVTIRVSIGEEIEHPNTTEHHIVWIELYFLPAGEKFVKHIGRQTFGSHGGSTQGPNTSGIFTGPSGSFSLKTIKTGKLLALSYCNIHGLWQGSAEIKA